MIRKTLLPILAVIGIGFTIFMIYRGSRTPPIIPLHTIPARSPYQHYVAGEGLVESIGENIEIGVPFPNLIWDICVESGDFIEKNQPLFILDTRQIEADLTVAQASLERAQTKYAQQSTIFSYYQQLTEKTAVSKQEYTDAYYNKQLASKEVIVASAEVARIQTILERSIIRSPIDGTVLQVNIRKGESANVNSFAQKTLILLGETDYVQLRANIAEENAWRIENGAAATAFVRGNPRISIPLTFDYIEPYIVPKQSLTGSDFERIDTRVLQVIYTFSKKNLPVYVGQLLDVYIEARPGNDNA